MNNFLIFLIYFQTRNQIFCDFNAQYMYQFENFIPFRIWDGEQL